MAMLAVFFLATPAVAERADRDKPVNIESDRMTADDARKTAVFEGRVVLTQGTMVIRADKITVRQDNQGFQSGTAVGNLAKFRQKREGSDEFVEGEAERIEYDGRADRVEFHNRAHLRRDCGDDVVGSFISYDARTEQFSVQSAKGPSAGKDERVRAVIMPKTPQTQSTKAPCAPLVSKPAPTNTR
jgi:lipopolysaccharide export system protein LptA